MDKQKLKLADVVFYAIITFIAYLFLAIHIYRTITEGIRFDNLIEGVGIIVIAIHLIRFDLKNKSPHKKIFTLFAIVIICITILFNLFAIFQN